MNIERPSKPHPDFPLSPNLNGQWYKVIKGAGSTKRKPYYFGSWRTDPKGERAIKEYVERLPGILAGTDHLRHLAGGNGVMTVSQLVKQYLTQRKTDAAAGTLSKRMYGDYIENLHAFVTFVRGDTAVTALCGKEAPNIFAGFVNSLIENRGLLSNSRRRVQQAIKACFRWGTENGKCPPPIFGTAFRAPKTTKAALRQEKARLGLPDHSKRIVTGEEIDKLLAICDGKPQFRAIVLLMVNCGLGAADIGRLRWKHLSADLTRLNYPRPKTGNDRMGYLWERTREALLPVKVLKHSAAALAKDGVEALVFVTRRGRSYYREYELVKELDGRRVVVGVRSSNPISITLGRMIRKLGLVGVTPYRFRHTFKTHGKKAKDKDALDLCMGHVENSVSATYDHEEISFKRIKKVSITVERRLWPKPRRQEDGNSQMRLADDVHDEQGQAA